MSLAAFCLTTVLIFILVIECFDSREVKPYISKKKRPPERIWIKSLIMAMNCCTLAMTKVITNMKVRNRNQPPGHHIYGYCYRCKKNRCGISPVSPCMTSMWSNGWTTTQAFGRQFDLDPQALMLDDGTSACITKDKDHFIEMPKHVDREVKGIKGHAKATH